MPRVNGLRKHKVAELLKLLEEGPSLHDTFTNDKYTPADAMQSTKTWLNSWVKPLVEELVPELRRTK